jgi:predicted amidohydrolase
MRICLAQIKVIPANPQANLQKMLECIEKANMNLVENKSLERL